MEQPILEARSLTVQRGGHRVLQNVSFTAQRGEVFALLGGNGAGKSTTLLTFLGLIPPESGEALAFGEPVHGNVDALRRKAAYLPETASLYPHLNAWENVRYFLSLSRSPRPQQDVAEAFDQVSLAVDARDRRLESYSKGMRQKVAIALALLRGVPLLLLDEPTSGLDPVAIDEFNALITRLAGEGTTVMMVTHDVYGACQVARRVGLLRRGEFVGLFEAPADGMISADELHQAFASSHAG
ncbi:MAG: ABC transporter ATP-binding protein [Pseudomonadota bacterium]